MKSKWLQANSTDSFLDLEKPNNHRFLSSLRQETCNASDHLWIHRGFIARLLSLTVIAVALIVSTQKIYSEESLSSYHSDRIGLTVSYPSGWDAWEESMQYGLSILFIRSPDAGVSDPFLENLNIIAVPTNTNDLSEAIQYGITACQKTLQMFILIDQDTGPVGSHEAAWFTNTFVDREVTYKAIKYVLIYEKTQYLVTGTALPDTFELFYPIFSSIVGSIAFH